VKGKRHKTVSRKVAKDAKKEQDSGRVGVRVSVSERKFSGRSGNGLQWNLAPQSPLRLPANTDDILKSTRYVVQPSFPCRRESSILRHCLAVWIPAFAGMTTFYESIDTDSLT